MSILVVNEVLSYYLGDDHFNIILFGRVCIMGSSFPRIEFTRLRRITGIVKNRRVIANPPILHGA